MATTKDWTAARKRSFIVSVLRAGTRRWPPKYEAMDDAKTEKKINKKTGRLAQHYLCNGCRNEFVVKDVQADHIQPVVGEEGFISWDVYIERMFCDKQNFQCLCTSCHSTKTKKERSGRKKSD